MKNGFCRIACAFIAIFICFASFGCKQAAEKRSPELAAETKAVLHALEASIGDRKLSGPEKRALEDFAYLIAYRRYCEDAVLQEKMDAREVGPALCSKADRMAKGGDPLESVVAAVWEGRKNLTANDRNTSPLFGYPEVCAIVALWAMNNEEIGPLAKERVRVIVTDLLPWMDPDKLPADEKAAFEQFCRFLSVRRYCDTEINGNRMNDEDGVRATQPLIDDLAKMGKPMETVLIQLLEARSAITPERRKKTALDETPEVFATIVLWTIKSKDAVPLLMKLAQNEDFENRGVFVRALGRIGDPQALPLLKELEKQESNVEVLTEARHAISVIEKEQESK